MDDKIREEQRLCSALDSLLDSGVEPKLLEKTALRLGLTWAPTVEERG